MKRKTGLIIGSGIGGLALGIRLQSLGFDTTILERLDGPGGRAYQFQADGFTFDMGPTVITVPHLLEELFSLSRDAARLTDPDFPAGVLEGLTGDATRKYVELVPIKPFYRIYFDDGTYFDYDGDPHSTRAQIAQLAPEDLAGYERFHRDAGAIFQRGFLELGYTHFGTPAEMLRVLPDLLRLDAVRTLFSFTSKYFRSPKMRRVFSFEPLLIGGNPLRVPAIYAMIHFVEKTWGVHYAMGGTGALVRALVRKYEELGGRVRYDAEVRRIDVSDHRGQSPRGLLGTRVARGVTLASGERLAADVVVSNADWATTYLKLVPRAHRRVNSDTRVRLARQSMSLVVVYFGFREGPRPLDLRHHNIILGPRYEGLLRDIFDRRVLAEDFSQYLHVPTLTDPSLAPPGHHAAYTLIPVPNQRSGLNWQALGPQLTGRVLTFLDEQGFIPGLRERLVYQRFVTPEYFETELASHLGNAFGPEPLLAQSAFFRPHNRSEDLRNLYLVGAGAQPGAGTPAVMMSAKMTARLIARDLGIHASILGRGTDMDAAESQAQRNGTLTTL